MTESDKEDLCVLMVNEELASAPVYELSSDYDLAWYRPGDEKAWVTIQSAADLHNTITDALFFQQFPPGTFDLEERQCYLYDRNSNAIATATAWGETDGPCDGYGLVHWMAVLPEFQHRGIGKMLMSVVCRRLVDLGHDRACLRTSTVRPDAIALYERFGFVTRSIVAWS